MRLPRCIIVTGTLLFARHSLASFSINLSELQPISGFSEACTQAYNAPLTDCTISDFYQGSTCSPGCVTFLEEMTKRLNDECKGITAIPNTLIGMFFKRTAVQQLCAGSDNFADGSDSVGSATVRSTAAPSPRSSTSTTSTVIETSTITTDPTISSATPSSTLSTRTSIVPSSTATAGQDTGDGSSTVTAGESPTTSPSDAQEDPTSNDASSGSGNGGDGNSNGGTVLEAAQSGSVKSIHGLSFLTTCAVLGVWFLMIRTGLVGDLDDL